MPLFRRWRAAKWFAEPPRCLRLMAMAPARLT